MTPASRDFRPSQRSSVKVVRSSNNTNWTKCKRNPTPNRFLYFNFELKKRLSTIFRVPYSEWASYDTAVHSEVCFLVLDLTTSLVTTSLVVNLGLGIWNKTREYMARSCIDDPCNEEWKPMLRCCKKQINLQRFLSYPLESHLNFSMKS